MLVRRPGRGIFGAMKRYSGWWLAGYVVLVTAGLAVMLFGPGILGWLGMAAVFLGTYAVKPPGTLTQEMTRKVPTRELIITIGILGAIILVACLFSGRRDPQQDDLEWLKSPAKVAVTIALWGVMMAIGVRDWRKLNSRAADQQQAV